MEVIVFGSNKVGGVKIITSSLYKSLKEIGYKTKYIYGFKVIKYFFKNFLSIYFGRNNKIYFITWSLYNFIPFPRKRVLCFMHGFPSAKQQDIFRYILFRINIIISKIRGITTISVSSYTQSILKDIYKINTKIIKNSIPYNTFVEAKYEELKKDIDIIFVGRANDHKLPIYILKNLDILANKGLSIYVFGEGTSKNKFLKSHNNSRIRFSKFISNKLIIKFLKRSKYFISCSSSEPFGIVFLEALLSGCKIISPRSGGLLEISSYFKNKHSNYFNFFDNEIYVHELLGSLDYNFNTVSSSEMKSIIDILKYHFDPKKHAIEVIKNFNEINK